MNARSIPFALSLACPELVEGAKGSPGFDRLSPNGGYL